MFLIWIRAWVFFASSVRPISLGTTRAASRPRMTMTTMISMRVNPDRSRSLLVPFFSDSIGFLLSDDL